MMSHSRGFAEPPNAKPRTVFGFLIYGSLVALAASASAQEDVKVTIETHFSPYRDGVRPIQDAWVRELGNASSRRCGTMNSQISTALLWTGHLKGSVTRNDAPRAGCSRLRARFSARVR